MIQEAFISGQLGKALYLDGERYFVRSIDNFDQPFECYPIDFSSFFCFGTEVRSLSNNSLNLTAIRSELEAQRGAHQGLSLIISGMDSELDDETRSSAIEHAESLMKLKSTRRFVQARMLARSLPADADIESAHEMAIRCDARIVGMLYQNVIEYQHAINFVLKTWEEASPEYFSSAEQRSEAGAKLTDLGAFADAVSAVATKNRSALNSWVVTYGQVNELKGVLGPSVTILNDFKSRLTKQLNAEEVQDKSRKQLADDEDRYEERHSVREVLAGFKNWKTGSRSKIFKADEAKERVDHQLEAISTLISQGNISRANRYLNDLIDFHVEHSERGHLAMSLCSLAKVAIDKRSFGIAKNLVDYALILGLDDVVIFSTQALLLKSMGEFEEARDVYEATMERFPNSEIVRGGYAELLKSMGEFEEARDVYEATRERFPTNEVVRGG
ncbi:MAG: tetratricopeptide repeat protein, partial [Pyrinomonadaceae bacterium]